jgi:pyruvate dehydrogenase E1 component
VVREGLWERYEHLFKNFGWDVVIVKYGSLQQAASREPGGERLRQWIDTCPNQLYSACYFRAARHGTSGCSPAPAIPHSISS